MTQLRDQQVSDDMATGTTKTHPEHIQNTPNPHPTHTQNTQYVPLLCHTCPSLRWPLRFASPAPTLHPAQIGLPAFMCSCLEHTLLVPVSNRPPLGIFTLPFPILGGLVTATDHYGMYIGKSAVTAVRHLVSCIQCQVQKTSVYNWIHLCIQYKYITSNGARWGKHTCKFQIKFLEYFQKKKTKKKPLWCPNSNSAGIGIPIPNYSPQVGAKTVLQRYDTKLAGVISKSAKT